MQQRRYLESRCVTDSFWSFAFLPACPPRSFLKEETGEGRDEIGELTSADDLVAYF
jgi:hypothetical protein